MANKEQEETISDDSYQITCTKISQEFKEEVIQKYAQVFTGLGRLEKPLHTEKDPTDTRCNLPPPPVEQYQPLALRERVKEELDDMEKRGVIRKVEEPTDWVNSMLIIEKAHGSFRFCLDLRQRNKAKKGTLSATHYWRCHDTHGKCQMVHHEVRRKLSLLPDTT